MGYKSWSNRQERLAQHSSNVPGVSNSAQSEMLKERILTQRPLTGVWASQGLRCEQSTVRADRSVYVITISSQAAGESGLNKSSLA
ncbi:hypothetical protein RRG08_008018 [Elysia crispata]|uniref:Uncharacterized protein n=1 Tax=Elysia crispata TaxID=231223 RepID=A0AAE0YRB2_9GAST|nr:hypothetical protein RRG08_008018 [Elysia crispata]